MSDVNKKSFFPIDVHIKNKSNIGYQNSDLFWGNLKKSVLLNKDTSTIVEDWCAWICPTNRNPEGVFSSESAKGVKEHVSHGHVSHARAADAKIVAVCATSIELHLFYFDFQSFDFDEINYRPKDAQEVDREAVAPFTLKQPCKTWLYSKI